MTAEQRPTIRTTAGDVRGVWRARDEHRYAAFLGVPYAAPPVGALRLREPTPPEPWPGVRDASDFGPTPQMWLPPDQLIPEASVPGDDILSVNVFTPAAGNTDARLPVMVWIHGGGYVSGSPASPWYDGGAFCRDGVVVVTVSYRLGFDGFGWVQGGPQNRGVLDWITALEWVRENIAAFGGDPGAVTIAGQSAGAGAVLTLLGLPRANGLFHRAIALSPALADVSRARAEQTAGRLARILDVSDSLAGFASATRKAIERHQVPAARGIPRAGVAAARDAFHNLTHYGPVVDGDLLPDRTIVSLERGQGATVPLLLGACDDEFIIADERYRRLASWVPDALLLPALGMPAPMRRAYRAANPETRGTANLLGRLISDRVFRRLVRRVADVRVGAAAHRPGDAAATWVYRFAWRSPVYGHAVHCLDVPFFFDQLGAEKTDRIMGPHPPRSLAGAYHGAAVDFIRAGAAGWQPWHTRPGTARVFDAPRSWTSRSAYAQTLPLLP